MSKKSIEWNRLDNAAKIFPSNTSKRDTKVFRFACELYEEVEPDLLQQALDTTVAYFPIFKSVLKKGLFWYYFEQSSLHPVVTEEHRPICSPIYDPNLRGLLFEVTYFGRRINFDVFHALTDGTGAMQFLRMLVSQYLRLKYPEQNLPALDYDASNSQKEEDSFQKYYRPEKGGEKSKRIKAYQLRGAKLPEGRLKVIEGVMPVKELLETAHRYEVTLTELVAAVLLRSIASQMAVHERKKPVVLAVPVNLRNYFNSETARNFFGVIYVRYSFGTRSGEFADVLAQVKESFQRELTQENLGRIISNYTKIERNALVRIVPLPLKNFVLKQAGRMNLQESTSSLSNIGKAQIPEELRPYIRLFDVICSTDRMQICLCSCGGLLTASFSSVFESTEVQKTFFRFFSELGINIEIASNDCVDDKPAVEKVNPLKLERPEFYDTPQGALKRAKSALKQAKKAEKLAKKQQKKARRAEKKTRKIEKKTEKLTAKAAKKAEKSARRQG